MVYKGLVSVVLVLFFAAQSPATLTARWQLDEIESGTDIWTVAESTGHYSSASVWGWVDLGAENGPLGGTDKSAYFHSNGIATNAPDVIPATGDFTLLMQIRTGAYSGYKHLFSSYNNTAGSALELVNGVLTFYGTGIGTISSGINVGDWVYHEVGVTRSGNDLSFLVDGAIKFSYALASGAVISSSDNWVIGCDRYKNSDYVGYIADIKVYNTDYTSLPEPATMLLLGSAGLIFFKKRSFQK
jgi:hypothetical protein